MVGWHHRLNGNEFEQTVGGNEEQEILMCYSSQGCQGNPFKLNVSWLDERKKKNQFFYNSHKMRG